jgi:hypothetical protein
MGRFALLDEVSSRQNAPLPVPREHHLVTDAPVAIKHLGLVHVLRDHERARPPNA